MSTLSPRLVGVWAWLTLGLLSGTLLLVVLAPAPQDPEVRGFYPSVGFATLLIFIATVAVIWSIQPVRIRVAKWTAWMAAATTMALTLGPIALWYLGREGLGFQVFQALGVSTGPNGFGDMVVVLGWLDCPRAGIDPYSVEAANCAVGPSNYGPAIFWLTHTGLSPAAAPLLGVLGVVASAIAIAWLVRQSRGLGRAALLMLSASTAWILLQERANLDAAIVWAAVLLVWLVRRYKGLWPWIVAAVPIWILGAWKYYPFAMGLALLPVLKIKHGWLVITGFLGLTIAYVVIMRDYVAMSLESNANLSDGRFGGFGRNIAAAFITGEAQSATSWQWGDLLIAAVLVAAFVWGWTVIGSIRRAPRRKGLSQVPLTMESMLAISGTTAILIAVGWSGFGYNYKAALLVLCIPLLARLSERSNPASFHAGVFMSVLAVMAAFVISNALLASLAVLVSAAFIGGAALRPLMAWVLPVDHSVKPVSANRVAGAS